MSKSLIPNKKDRPFLTAFFMIISSVWFVYISFNISHLISIYEKPILPSKVYLTILIYFAITFIITCILHFKYEGKIYFKLFNTVCLIVAIIIIYAIYQWFLSVVFYQYGNIFDNISMNFDRAYVIFKFNKIFFINVGIIAIFGYFIVLEVKHFLSSTNKKEGSNNAKQ